MAIEPDRSLLKLGAPNRNTSAVGETRRRPVRSSPQGFRLHPQSDGG